MEEKTSIDYKDKYLRLLADQDNFFKRQEKELARQVDKAKEDFIHKLLTTLDSLDLAVKAKVEGAELIRKQLLDVLASEDCFVIIKKEFDPYYHEAIEIKEGDEDKMEEVIKGYILKDKIIRSSKVIIYKRRTK